MLIQEMCSFCLSATVSFYYKDRSKHIHIKNKTTSVTEKLSNHQNYNRTVLTTLESITVLTFKKKSSLVAHSSLVHSVHD